MQKKLIIIAILFLSAFSISLTYSALKNTSTGTGTINGASWSVSMVGNNDDIELTSGNTEQAYLLTVNNNSEVNVSYSIKLTNLPDDVRVKLDSNSYVSETNNEITFENAGSILYGANPVNHTLTFTAPLDAPEITNQNFNISVEFKQTLN